jgi:dienelactone hydrolase
MMGLQTWNSVRALDFLLGLEGVDPARIGVTGASGGGTQSMILAAIDDRITAAMPCVMVSTAMQGGCTCENAPYLRVGQGNIDIAAAVAPRPLGMTAADDWTIELETKGYPELMQLYADLGVQDRLTAAFHTQFKHNYNHVNRVVMYGFFNRHFKLGFNEPILERDFQPLTREEATVWSDPYQPPSGDAVGDSHEVRLLELATEDSEAKMDAIIAATTAEDDVFQSTVGTAWSILLDRKLIDVGEVNFEQSGGRQSDLGKITWGTLSHDRQRLPVAQIDPADGNAKATVVWITDRGKADLFAAETRKAVQQILQSGYRIVTADLLGQGEFTADGSPVQEQPMWYQRGGETGWQQFSGYTYGYNHSLFAKRVHDVLALIQFAAGDHDSPVHLVGTGKQAGAIALAARSQAGGGVAQTFVDPKGFRFESLTRQDHPMFVPGAVKYLDIDGLIGLCLPGEVHVVGPPSDVVTRIATARGAGDTIQWHESAEALITAMSDTLSR